MSGVLGPLLAFAAVIAAIPLALWLLRRTPLGQAASQGPMRVVGALPLGPQQRVVTVEVGTGEHRRWLVLGVSPSGISTLHGMPPQADPAPPAPVAAPPFAQLLRRRQAGPASDADHAH